MNIVLPYVGELDARVADALRHRDDVLVVGCPGEDSYHELLRRCWATQMDFLVVEHDIVVTDAALDDLIDCPEPWCAQPYRVAGQVQTALGCTRFRGEFTQEWAGLWDAVRDYVGTHWSVMDAALKVALGNNGVEVHQHAIEVTHLNPRADVVMDEATRDKVDAQLKEMRTARLLDLKTRSSDPDSPDTALRQARENP